MKGKRFLLLLLVFALSVSLLGCGEMSDAEVQLRHGLRMFFNRFTFFQPTSFYGFSGNDLDNLQWGAEQLRAGMEESTALLQKYPNAYASLQLLVQIPTVLRSLYEAEGTEKLTFGDLPPAWQACLYDVDILLYPCLFAWTESDGSSVMGLFALMESSGSAINFLDRNVVSRQGIEWPEPIDWTPPDV